MNDCGYIYIGTYFHHHGKDLSNLTEKKIGKSINVPNRENALNSTKFTIGYTMIKYWAVEEMSKVEKSLQAILPNRLNGEWFEDNDETLVDRVSKFMEIVGGKEENVTTNDIDPIAKKIIQSAKDRSRVAELAGQQFTYTREGITVTVEITPDGEFKNLATGSVYGNPSSPFWRSWEGIITGSSSINGWAAPKNAVGRSIDQELALLPEKSV
jgi:T5orf172 domain